MSLAQLRSLHLPEEVQDRVKQYVGLVNKEWQADLEALVLFGSAARGDFVEGRSNINLVFIVRAISADILQRAGHLHRKWGKHQFVAPLMMTLEDLQRSCRLFPLEYVQMKESHVLLAGRDPFSDWIVDRAQLGRHCEQEIMAHVLRLRQRYIEGEGRAEAIQALLILSITGVIPCLRGLNWVWGHPSSGTDSQILQGLPPTLQFDPSVLSEVLQMKRGLSSPGSYEWNKLYQRYLHSLELLITQVEHLRKESGRE